MPPLPPLPPVYSKPTQIKVQEIAVMPVRPEDGLHCGWPCASARMPLPILGEAMSWTKFGYLCVQLGAVLFLALLLEQILTW